MTPGPRIIDHGFELQPGEWNRTDDTGVVDTNPVTGQFHAGIGDTFVISDEGVVAIGDWAIDVDIFRSRAEACVRALLTRELDGKASKP